MCGSGEQSANYYYFFFFLLILVSKHWFSLKMWWTGGWWWMWSGLVATSLFDLDSSCAAQEPRLTDSLEKGSWGDKKGLPHLSNYSFPPDAKHVASWKKNVLITLPVQGYLQFHHNSSFLSSTYICWHRSIPVLSQGPPDGKTVGEQMLYANLK